MLQWNFPNTSTIVNYLIICNWSRYHYNLIGKLLQHEILYISQKYDHFCDFLHESDCTPKYRRFAYQRLHFYRIFLSINWMYRFARVYLVYFNRPVKLFKMPYPAKIINNVTYCPIVTVKLYPIRQLYHRLWFGYENNTLGYDCRGMIWLVHRYCFKCKVLYVRNLEKKFTFNNAEVRLHIIPVCN